MRFMTYLSGSGPRRGVVAGDALAPIPGLSLLDLIAEGEAGLVRARQALAGPERVALEGLERLAPIPEPRRNVFCLGWNYAEHSREAAAARAGQLKPEVKLPERPIFFTKATTAVIGPGAPIPLHARTTAQLDWEVELGVVIGRGGRDIPRDQAMAHVFGYTVINDVSAREVQILHGKQFFKGKSLDGTCPMGPWIVTADEVPDPHALALSCRVNGVEKQAGNTADFIFDIPAILEWLSAGMTLLPGDIIATGTPAGVGFARTPPEFLRAGDVLASEISGVGLLENPVQDV